MFGLFKRRKSSARMSKQISLDLVTVANLVSVQTRYLMFFHGAKRENFWGNGYFRLYVLGAFDAATTRFGIDIRKSLGPGIREMGYVNYLVGEFGVDKSAAKAYLDETVASDRYRDPAVQDGGTDGMAALSGAAPDTPRLLARFMDVDDGEREVTPEEMQAFQRFCNGQDHLTGTHGTR
ncbi:hypothetical protein [uncultured Methylobacterium sp.]|uniref:hypothetical protein n=1 Tax=uncultured Methylobacterium sp. TaxID=157278 RepID=UPI0035C9FC35